MKIIFYVSVPILLMIAMLPIVPGEFARMAIFALITLAALLIIKAGKLDWFLFTFGFVVMSFFEYIFVATSVETFLQRTYLGVMPLWLPILWGYSFVALRRGIREIEIKFIK